MSSTDIFTQTNMHWYFTAYLAALYAELYECKWTWGESVKSDWYPRGLYRSFYLIKWFVFLVEGYTSDHITPASNG